MQNRYTDAIGDYSKLGLLGALHSAGFSNGLQPQEQKGHAPVLRGYSPLFFQVELDHFQW